MPPIRSRPTPWLLGKGCVRVLRLTSLSFAHPVVPSDRRALLALPENALRLAHRRLVAAGHEAFLLSTCLRVEIAWVGAPHAASELLAVLYGDGALAGLAQVRPDEDAFRHLCRVAAGLESPLIGEPEVLGQFRRAVASYNETPAASASLGRVLEAAIGVGRNGRRLIDHSPRGSLAAAAAAAAPLGRVAVLGAGSMARATAEQLEGVEVSVFARRPGTVAGRNTLAWEAAVEAFAHYPAVISTVPGKVPLFGEDVIVRALARRREPLLLVDLGMPPGFPSTGADDPVRYLGIDELASTVEARPSVVAAERIAEEAAATWRRLTASDRAGAVIAAMVGQGEEAVTDVVQRFAGRLAVVEDPERILRQVAHTVARRVLHRPISFVGTSGRGTEAVDLLAEAFGIDDD